MSTNADRRRAHRALAAQLADQPERQAWHLADPDLHDKLNRAFTGPPHS
ncbi:hypothetical protein [Trebonia kvetii]|nr:hypothetical protein [Trebonia kvetii]